MKHRWLAIVAGGLVWVSLGADRGEAAAKRAAPLTERQARLLTDVGDDGNDDATALAALVANARDWSPLSADFDTHLLPAPDWKLLQTSDDLSAIRGDLYRVEGWLVEKRDPPGLTAEGESIRVWAIGIGKSTAPHQLPDGRVVQAVVPDHVALVVYPEPPPGDWLQAAVEHPLSIPCRFFKRLSFKDADGVTREIPIFVAPYWSDYEQGAASGGVGGGGRPTSWMSGEKGPWLVGAAVVVIAAAWFFLRRLAKSSTAPRPLPNRSLVGQRRREREAEDGGDDEVEDEGDPLPEDPADALTELERRHAADPAAAALEQASADAGPDAGPDAADTEGEPEPEAETRADPDSSHPK